MHHIAQRHITGVIVTVSKWIRRHRQVVIITTISVVAAIVAVQLAYPSGHALPFTKIGDSNMSFASRDTIADQLRSLQKSAKIIVTVQDKPTADLLANVGVTIDNAKTTNAILDYPLWQRIIPLSILFSKAEPQVLKVVFDETKLGNFAGKVSESAYVAAKNASLSVESVTIKVHDDEPGAKVEPSHVIEGIKATTYRNILTNITLKRDMIPVARRTSDIQAVKKQAEAIIKTATSLTVGDKKYDVARAELASWLTFSDGDKDALVVGLDDTKMSAYLASISRELTINPGITKVNMIDGHEVGRVTGSTGRGIDVTGVKKAIQDAVMAGKSTVAIKTGFVTLQPIEQFNKQFTASPAGLQAYVDDLVATKDMNIAVQQLNSSGWSANAKASDQVISASTYKLFVAYVLFEKIKTGGYSWTQPMLDTDIAGCFDRMIVRSDNACAEKFIDMITPKTLDDTIHAGGFSAATTFRSTVATKTSAADQLRLLVGLQNGSIIGGSDRDRLLDAMGRQIYRAGIPSGSSGTVQDKVGFLNEVINDSAIVTTGRGTYVLSIMTRNSTWGEVAAITRQIESLMYP